MISYFEELLNTLKNVLTTLKYIEEHLSKISSCVKSNDHNYGDILRVRDEIRDALIKALSL